MEGIFANWNFVRSDKPIVVVAVGCLSLSKGEGEGEGLFRTGSPRSLLNPSPQSSPLGARREAANGRKQLSASNAKFPARVV
jgi:hypothetical protein